MRLCILALCASWGLWAAPANAEVTFHKDVEPVLQSRCQGCHRPGEAAPMALLTYKDVRPWAKAIREAVLDRKMPPWYADGAHGEFSNDRRLSKEEIAKLAAWVDGGAKEGDPRDAPQPIAFAEGWAMGKPDAVVEMPVAYDVPASGTVEYTYFVVPTGFTEDKWVRQVEVRPGTKSVVHEIVGVYVPGGVPYVLKPGQACLIPKGSDLIFQIHYTTNGKAASDRSRIGFIFAGGVPEQRVVNTLVSNGNLHIPPQAADHAVTARVTLYEETRLLSLFPHMHVRGKAFEYRAIYPTGESEILLTVPKYDFNWQLTYYLKHPKVLPKGTVLECVARYDNSPNNPFNPDPRSDVYWGDQSWDEMMAGFVDLAMPVNLTMRDVAVPKQAKQPKAAGGVE